MVVKTQPKRRHRRLNPRGKNALISLLIGAIIGGLAGVGHLQSVKLNAQAEKIEELTHELELAEIPITLKYITEPEEKVDFYAGLELLAKLVEAEAGDQDFQGKCLVVDVVLNRVESEDYPNTITDVIMQKYQFSSVWDGGLDRAAHRMQNEDYRAVITELQAKTDDTVLYFTAGGYGDCGTPAYQHGDHYFSRR